jgi:hypothetical protein
MSLVTLLGSEHSRLFDRACGGNGGQRLVGRLRRSMYPCWKADWTYHLLLTFSRPTKAAGDRLERDSIQASDLRWSVLDLDYGGLNRELLLLTS